MKTKMCFKKGDRLILRVKRIGKRWYKCDEKGRVIHPYGCNKRQQVANVAYDLQRFWNDFRQPGQLIVHKANGEIQEERTYPDTTPKRKG